MNSVSNMKKKRIVCQPFEKANSVSTVWKEKRILCQPYKKKMNSVSNVKKTNSVSTVWKNE